MGEAPKGPPVPNNKEEVAAVVGTSKDEEEKFERPKHRLTSPLPSTMPTATASDSDGEGTHKDEETQNSVTTLTGVDTTTECSSSDEDDTDRELSHANSKAKANVVAFASSPKGKISFTGGKESKPSSMTSRHAGSLGNSKVYRPQHQQRIPPKKEPKPKGVRKTARFGAGDSEVEEERKKNKSKHSTSWSRKSLHRAKIAKEYSTSESEDEVPEVPDAKQFSSSQHHLQPKSSSINKSMPKAVIDLEKSPSPRSHGVKKDDGNSSTDSETSTTTTTYDSDDEEDDGDEHEPKRRRIHSRKPSLHTSPAQVKTWRVNIADDDESIPASSMREYYRSDVESHDADHEHQLWEDQDDDTDDDRHIRKMKRTNKGNSASFSGAASRNFRWSNVKTKIFYSFRAKGNDSDDEGSKVISVRNLAPVVSEQILQEFFGGCGTVTFVNISRDEFGRCSGSAYVEFDSGAAARKALQKTGTTLWERVVFCDVAHETSTSRHVESKAPPGKPAEPPPAPPPAGSSGPTGGGIDLHFLLKAFHRSDNSEDSVRSRHNKSKSSESLHFPKGVISPGDTLTVPSGNEQSVHNPNTSDESTRETKAASTGRGSKKKLFGLSKSKSSGSSRNSGKLGGSQSHSQSQAYSRDPELDQHSQSPSKYREVEVQSQGIEVESGGIQSRGIKVQTQGNAFQSRAIAPHSSPILETAFQESQNEELVSSNGHKKRKWNFREWRGKHRWVKISLWKWVKKPRWHHWWHFANLSARWGKASRRPSVKSTSPPDFQEEPPEGYPRFSSSSNQRSSGPVAGA